MGRARAPAAEGGKARRRPACHTRPRGSPGGLALDLLRPRRDCMAGLRNSCDDGFAYSIDAKEGGYVLNITNFKLNSTAILTTHDKVTGQVVFELT